jgi:hypothetical protein
MFLSMCGWQGNRPKWRAAAFVWGFHVSFFDRTYLDDWPSNGTGGFTHKTTGKHMSGGFSTVIG